MINFQPLRIASGWTIEWNSFMKTDPHPDDMTDFSGSSLLHAYNRNTKRAINLEWKPEEDYDGEFILRVINLEEYYNSNTKEFDLSGDWENPHYEFCSRDRQKIVSEIEELMLQLLPYEDPRILKSRGVVDDEAEDIRKKLLNPKISDDVRSYILHSDHKKLQDLLLDHTDVKRKDLLFLSEHGAVKGIKNKASQKLNSKSFRNQK
jgi:hypothetical protein